MNKSINVKFIGCRLNQFESDFIKSTFLSNGYKSTKKNADVCVVNTCTVTSRADSKSRKMIRKLKNENPGTFMIATGCMVDTNKNELKELKLIDMFVENSEKINIVSLLNKKKDAAAQEKVKYTTARTRPSVKIQDGCDHLCSYCKVRIARGKSRSESFDDIIKTAEFLAEEGYREIVLTGINIGDYKDKDKKLKDLLAKLIEIKQLKRIRLSSIEATNIDDSLIKVLKHEKICKYFHLPLQTGSDKILELMRRPYDSRTYKKIINKLKNLSRDVIIGTDIIVGFPGETEKDFQDTYNFLKQNNIFYLHIFPYSPRENTEALSFSGNVPDKEKQIRYDILNKYQTGSKIKYFKSLLNKNLDVLVEKKVVNKKYISSTSSNYVTVLLPLSKYKEKIGEIINIQVKKIEKERVFGG